MGRLTETCILSLLATTLVVQLQLTGSQSLDGSSPASCATPAPSPTVTANASLNSSLLQLPRPPPVPPAPPLPPDDPPLGPRPLLLGQCAVGAESAQTSRLVEFADAEKLYVDVGRPAECSGVVARWEVCFRDLAAPAANVQIAVLRPQNSTTHRFSSVSELRLEPGDSEAAEAICQYLEATVDVVVEQGDLIGFMSSDRIRIALSTHSSRSLHVYTQSIQSQDGQLSSIGPVQQSQLRQLRQAVAPLIRIVINMTNMSTAVVPSPTETSTPCPTDAGTNGRNRTARFYYILISAVIVAAVVIMILFVVVCVLLCCICKVRCKLSKCCKLKKKEKKAQSQVSIPDQSMQYNDLYVPKNPSHIIHNGRRFTAQIHDNPAYGNQGSSAPRTTSHVHNPGNDDQQTTSSAPHVQEDHTELSHSHTRRGLDHTYETVR